MPDRPVLIYDGDCGFCRRWAQRWRFLTGESVEYVPAEAARDRFSHAVPEAPQQSVALVRPDGTVLHGAAAVFEALAGVPGHGWKRLAYARVPGFARASEWCYGLVARHRRAVSRVCALLWGRDPAPSTYVAARWLFLRALGIIYLVAFLSLWVQVHGLIGRSGILPAERFLEWARAQLGPDCYTSLPTLGWLGAGDGALDALCAAGVLASVLLIAGVAPIPILAVLWAVYLSLAVLGQTFLSFQWDSLLLEAGFLALFVAPAGWLPGLRRQRRPPARGLLLIRLLLFKLMFLSGATKLLSGDPTWRELTALDYHYETQPLPSWVAWYGHHLPDWLQKASVLGMFAVELFVPLLIFAPRRPRHAAAGALIGLQLVIAINGSYGFFNLLACALCLPLLDDRLLSRLVPGRLRGFFAVPPPRPARAPARWAATTAAVVVAVISGLAFLREMVRSQSRPAVPDAVTWVLDGLNGLIMYNGGARLLDWADPFRTLNGYGLFRVMTTQRPEIVIEGSDNGLLWKAYEFRWKPGEVTRRPRYAAPHQPRLDWQMWFAALNPRGSMHWLRPLAERLLEGSEPVHDLLAENPFPDGPPRSVRFMYYRYRFADPATRRATGAWWHREFEGPLTRPISARP